MRVGVLFSGGKDSTYAVYAARGTGHDICCLLTVHTPSPDSHLLHHPGTAYTKLQARSMGIDWRGEHTDSPDTSREDMALDGLVQWAIQKHDIQGLVHGGIRSRYQQKRFAALCNRHSLSMLSPVWGYGSGYVERMLQEGFRFVVISVSAGGLDGSWLGRVMTQERLQYLHGLSAEYGVAVDFEGGEAETFVVDCPLFSSGIMLCGVPSWDGYTGRFEISGARLMN